MLIHGFAVAVLLGSPGDCGEPFALRGPKPSESVVLATATGRSLAVVPPLGFLSARELVRRRPTVMAFEFVVNRANPVADNRGRISLSDESWGMLVPDQRFLVIPWDYDESCEPHPWPTTDWIPTGAQVVFRIESARLHQGVRIVDVDGRQMPYPYVESVGQDSFEAPGGPVLERLGARQVWQLLLKSPRAEVETPRDVQLRQLEGVYRGGSTTLLERFPGPELLAWARQWASGDLPAP